MWLDVSYGLQNINELCVLDSPGSLSDWPRAVLNYIFFNSVLPPFRFSGLAISVPIVVVGKDVGRKESTPTVPSESWIRYFYVTFGIAQENNLLTPLLFLLFWEWSNLTWFPTWKLRRGGSALSCNIDQQALITIITAVLSNMVWTCDTSVCLKSPFNFKNKGFNFNFVLLCLHLYLLFLI